MNKILAIVLLAAAVAQAKFIPEIQDAIVLHPALMKMERMINVPAQGRDQDGKIIGGSAARLGEYPHQCRMSIATTGGNYLCGCSIIDASWSMTAAHCLDIDGITSITLHAGEISTLTTEATEQTRTITAANQIIHPNWMPNLIRNDIGLMRLSSPWTFNTDVNCVKIAETPEADTLAGRPGQVSGFGKTADTGSSSTSLQHVTVDFITNTQCAATYGNTIQDSNICTSVQGGKGTCSGDSGGPLIDESKIQRGIVSFGLRSGCVDGPSAFSRVSSFHSWVIGHTGQLRC